VRLNLPCGHGYNPSLPRVLKIRSDGDMSSDSLVYMDDGRTAGSGRKNCRHTSRRLSSMVNYLGEQDASRKRRPDSLAPGAWSGKLLHCNNAYPVKSVPQEKWDDIKDGLDWIIATAKVDDYLDTVGLRRVAGKGMSQTEVYNDLRPYYRSFFNALEAWRENRDLEGWHLARAEEDAVLMAERSAGDYIVLGDSPREVRITASLRCSGASMTRHIRSSGLLGPDTGGTSPILLGTPRVTGLEQELKTQQGACERSMDSGWLMMPPGVQTGEKPGTLLTGCFRICEPNV